MKQKVLGIVLLVCLFVPQSYALERPEVEFKIFQFPANMIPRVDGKTDDWVIVPESYVIGTDQLSDTVKGRGTDIDPKDFNVKVRLGWVNGLNRIYFLYEAYDDFWDFKSIDLHNDIFEIVVDADLSGGPLIKQMNPNLEQDREFVKEGKLDKPRISAEDLHFTFHSVHAQNYHIFTPAEGKEWTMVWGCQPWIKDLPWANAAYDYKFKHGEGGKLVLEFWITPFDYAAYEGPGRSVVSQLKEDKIVGISWSVLEYDNNESQYEGFINLSHKTTMYGNATDLCAFRLMPLEKRFRRPVEAQWIFTVVDMDRRLVAFKDMSYGNITSWTWDFGDGTTSTEQYPIHQYEKPGEYVVVLYVEGPEGKDRRSKVWDVVLK
ncbi:MAG: PKD domain-containing protein [Candidatus Latescibacteria bacterium]|nr:PKD domain-containing protein [Candidatus Latescibacterota bacterium]